MIDEELDQARAEEAHRIAARAFNATASLYHAPKIAARLAREGWTPEDPLLKEAREILIAKFEWSGVNATSCRDGECDRYGTLQMALTALKRGVELGKAKALTRDAETIARIQREAEAGRKF